MSRPLLRALFALFVGILPLSAGSGCGTKKDLDRTADLLLESLRNKDYQAFERVAHPALMKEVPQAKFEEMSTVLAALGPLKDRTMEGISVASGKPDEGKYKVEFERGPVQLALKADGSTIVGFEFTGDLIAKAAREVRDARFRDLAVHAFEFVGEDDKPNPRGNLYAVGASVGFRFGFGGVHARDGKFHVKMTLILRTADGSEIGRQAILDKEFPAPADGLPVADIHGSFPARKAGALRVELELTDAVQGKTITYGQSVVIE